MKGGSCSPSYHRRSILAAQGTYLLRLQQEQEQRRRSGVQDPQERLASGAPQPPPMSQAARRQHLARIIDEALQLIEEDDGLLWQ